MITTFTQREQDFIRIAEGDTQRDLTVQEHYLIQYKMSQMKYMYASSLHGAALYMMHYIQGVKYQDIYDAVEGFMLGVEEEIY